MKKLNYKQLALILHIKPIEAYEKIIFVHCKVKNITAPQHAKKISHYSTYPASMEIELLAEHLNLPDLQLAVDDIRNNYLKRSATKKYILNDYPEHQLQLQYKNPRKRITLPSVLCSMLNEQDIGIIKGVWKQRHKIKV